jgi:hypothetical protein
MDKGIVDISGTMPLSYNVAWYPEEDRKKIFHKNIVWLKRRAEGYRCARCKKVIAILDEKASIF